MVVHEDGGVGARHQVPGAAAVARAHHRGQLGDAHRVVAAEGVAEGVGELELVDGAVGEVITAHHGAVRNHLLRDEHGLAQQRRLRHLREDGLEIRSPHVLGRVDAEAIHAHVDERGEVLGDLPPGIRQVGGHVRQAHQPAVHHVVPVGAVVRGLDAAVRVKVTRAEERVLRRAGVVGGAIRGGARASRHLVEDHVRVDAHARVVAGVDHVLQRGGVSHVAHQAPVVDGLVDVPPRVGGDVRLRRGDLHGAKAIGAEELRALGGDVVPPPLEQLHIGVGRIERHERGLALSKLRLRGRHTGGGDTSGEHREEQTLHLRHGFFQVRGMHGRAHDNPHGACLITRTASPNHENGFSCLKRLNPDCRARRVMPPLSAGAPPGGCR